MALSNKIYKNRPKYEMMSPGKVLPSIIIVAPKEGDVITPDKDVWIIWNQTDSKPLVLNIFLKRVGESSEQLIDNNINGSINKFLWKLSSFNIKSSNNQYQIVIKARDWFNKFHVTVQSGKFYISNSPIANKR